jgi:hypothetical protein
MPRFAPKLTAPLQTKSAMSMNSEIIQLGQSRKINPLLHLQRAIGNRAVQQLMEPEPPGRKGKVASMKGGSYEQHANAVADATVKSEPAEPLLHAYARSYSSSSAPQVQFQFAPTRAPRRMPLPERRDSRRLNSGTMSWSLIPRNNANIGIGGSVGVHVRFTPNERLASEGHTITFIQTVFEFSAGERDRTIGTARVDTLEHETDPYYGVKMDPDTGEWRSEGYDSHPFTGSEGSAELFDLPQIPNGQGKRFETVAVIIVDNEPQVLASLLWRVEVRNNITEITIEGFREGVATREFAIALAEFERSGSPR